ncbi:hypothetical protein GGF31_003846 [Allomyces arbusculus]|nr:hypothetical protein GGF31_003846 [Allomyces arbusculus]
MPTRATDHATPLPWSKVPSPRAALVRIMDAVSTVIQSELRLPHVRDLIEDAPPRCDRELRATGAPGQVAVIRRRRRALRYSVAPQCVQCGEKEAQHARPVCEVRIAARHRIADIL